MPRFKPMMSVLVPSYQDILDQSLFETSEFSLEVPLVANPTRRVVVYFINLDEKVI